MRTTVLVLAAALGAPATAAASRATKVPTGPDPVTLADPFLGTESGGPDFGTGGGAGNTYPGATLPFGLVQFSPDTFPDRDTLGGGYAYRDHVIRGFSVDHISGAGCAAEQDFPLTVVTGTLAASPAIAGSARLRPRFEARFDHARESASPGRYTVTLNPGGSRAIRAALTASARTADARFAFPRRSSATALINAGGSAMGDTQAAVTIDRSRREISGSAQSGWFCYQPGHYRVYFAARFSRAFRASGAWRRERLLPGARGAADRVTAGTLPPTPQSLDGAPAPLSAPSTGAQAGAYASFAPGPAVTVQIGVSYVSVAGARANLAAEAAGRSFADLQARATRTWRGWLDRVRVTGGSRRQQRLFASQLYHALLMPNTLSDVTGRYPGMDGRVHRTRTTEYANYSGWDIYRSQFPLLAMLAPRTASAMAASLLDEGAQSSGQLPKWSQLSTQNDIMVGDPADLMLSGAWAFGARRFPARPALAAMVHSASVPGRSTNDTYVERAGLADYLRLGYVPAEDDVNVATQTYVHTAVWGAVSTTLEYALADFGIARFAHSLGAAQICRRFAGRGANWRRVLDPGAGYVRLRARDGAWVAPFSPLSSTGFAEGDAAQYTWAVPQDAAGLTAALHGPATVRARLGAFFTHLNGGQTSPDAFLGNEPTLDVPYLYDWLGRPSAGAAVIRRALLSLYAPRPGGAPGNDDAGEMAAWWVLSALGLYPAVPGTDVLALTAPLFPRAIVRLPGGTLQINAPGAAAHSVAIQSAAIDGRPLTRTWLPFARLRHGGQLDVVLARRGGSWGTAASARPPSFSPAATCTG
jgi:predicted alpha-1,2-mannosidase